MCDLRQFYNTVFFCFFLFENNTCNTRPSEHATDAPAVSQRHDVLLVPMIIMYRSCLLCHTKNNGLASYTQYALCLH